MYEGTKEHILTIFIRLLLFGFIATVIKVSYSIVEHIVENTVKTECLK